MGSLASSRDADLRRLTREVVAGDPGTPFGVYVFDGNEPASELGRHVERTVFLETFGNTQEMLAEEYDPYEEGCFFICVVDHLRHLPVGAMRVISLSPSGFKSLNDLELVWSEPAGVVAERTGLTMPPERTWDVATLAVAPDYRAKATGGLISMSLYQSVTLAARACGVDWLVAILDMPVFRLLRWRLRMVFAGYEGVAPRPYLGSLASIPAWCDLVATDRRLASVDEDLHAILYRGLGLEHAVRVIDGSALEQLASRQRRAVALSLMPTPAAGGESLAS
jgi:hypothetical protein